MTLNTKALGWVVVPRVGSPGQVASVTSSENSGDNTSEERPQRSHGVPRTDHALGHDGFT